MQQLRCGLFADAGNAGKVVGRIALEPAIIGQLRRFQTEALAHRRDVVAPEIRDPAARRQHRRELVDDLQQIEIAGDDDRVLAGVFDLTRQRRDHVVGLLPFHLDDRDVEGREDLPHERELSAQFVRHRVALRLVLLVQREALGRHALVEGGDDVRRLLVGNSLFSIIVNP